MHFKMTGLPSDPHYYNKWVGYDGNTSTMRRVG